MSSDYFGKREIVHSFHLAIFFFFLPDKSELGLWPEHRMELVESIENLVDPQNVYE